MTKFRTLTNAELVSAMTAGMREADLAPCMLELYARINDGRAVLTAREDYDEGYSDGYDAGFDAGYH